jgi:TPR repeat protein
VAWLLRKTNAYTRENKFELAARTLREIIYCYESPEARVDLAGLLSERKVQPDMTFDLKEHYDQLAPNASTYEIAAAGHLSAAAFGEKPYAEALVNLGWAHLLGRGVAANASRSLELFSAGVDASQTSYEATPCVLATVLTKV